MLLEVQGLQKRFGGLRAVSDVGLTVNSGEILGLIGPNGSGKSTVMNLIMGIHKPDAGQINLKGTNIAGWPAFRIAQAGVSMVFQHSRPLQQQSVLQNVQLALLPDRLMNLRLVPSVEKEAREILALVGLGAVADRLPSELPFAGLRRMELAKSLARKPSLMLLDEPFAGLSSSEVREFSDLILSLRDEGRAIILVDHNVKSVRALVDRVVAMSSGQKIADDLPDKVLQNEKVREVYLGVEGQHVAPRESVGDAAPPVLELRNVSVRYGKALALNNVSMTVREGDVTAIVGLNGAGKTSLFNAVCGIEPSQGDILYKNRRISGQPPHRMAREGVVLCPETRELFGDMTVIENLRMGGNLLPVAEMRRQLEFVESLFPRLAERRTQAARTLSGGEQQMLAIGRGLMMKPELLLIDEPTLGLAPIILDVISSAIEALRQAGGMSLLIAEQNMTFALRHANLVYLLEHGEITWQGPVDRFASEAGARVL